MINDPLEYSIIVPAYNEVALIVSTIEAIKMAMDAVPESGELIVVDNGSTDATSELAKSHGAKIVHEPVQQISRSRNARANAAVGRFLIFIDADTQLTGGISSGSLESFVWQQVLRRRGFNFRARRIELATAFLYPPLESTVENGTLIVT